MKRRLITRKRIERWIVLSCVPIVLLLRLIRPLVWVRFGWLQTHKIGHLPLEVELYLCERKAGIQPQDTIDLFFDRRRGDGKVCNQFAMNMADRSVRIFPWAKFLAGANEKLPHPERHAIYIKAREQNSVRDKDGLFSRFPVQIPLTPAEEERGAALLTSLGVPAGSRYVCLHVRNSLYWKTRDSTMSSDSDFRNSDIRSFSQAVRALIDAGFYVVQIGFPAEISIDILDPRYIDYSRSARSDFMDIYLAAHCYLMISTGSGMDSISYMFRRPILMCNLAPLSFVFSDKENIVNLPKLYRRTGAAHFMTFRDAIASGAGSFVTTEEFNAAGIEVHEARPEVIRDAVLEMIDKIEGTWQDSTEDSARQHAFWHLLRNHPLHGEIRGHISTVYLRAYSQLL